MDIYSELGVPGFINARAPYTRFGGAVLPAPVVEAMAAASRRGTLMAELQEKTGVAIARLTQNEARDDAYPDAQPVLAYGPKPRDGNPGVGQRK